MPPRPSFLRGSKPPPRIFTHPRCESRRANSTVVSHHPPTTIDEPSIRPQPYPLPQSSVQIPPRPLISDAKPFSHFLTDSFARQHDYLRISVTERCNLRCTYCMPEEGVPLSQTESLLTTPEIVYLSSLFVSQGVNKIRLTGGEPTVRKDIVSLMQQIGNLRGKGLRELCLTTNGIALHRKLDAMVEAGLTGVNLSLDTLDPFQFQIMTRRKGFDAVIRTIDRILEMNRLGAGIKLKINCVVMRGINERDIIPFVEMGREKDVEVRFIEYMPFDGNKWSQKKMLSYKEMLGLIREKYPKLEKVQDHANDTSKTYRVPGFLGKLGFITSMTHNFCGSCNRLRITSDGSLKVCLFGNTEVSLRDALREGNDGQPFDEEAMETLKKVEMNRQQALPGAVGPLGFGERERDLLEIIGMAVKRKKEKHAGMGKLENMKNRPMILIDDLTPSILPLHQALGQSRLVQSWSKRPSVLPIYAGQSLLSMSNPYMDAFLRARQQQQQQQFRTAAPQQILTAAPPQHAFTTGTPRQIPQAVFQQHISSARRLREIPATAPQNLFATRPPQQSTTAATPQHVTTAGPPRLFAPALQQYNSTSRPPQQFTTARPPQQFAAAAPANNYSTAAPSQPTLTHLNASSEVQMVNVSSKPITHRVAIAAGSVVFSSLHTRGLVQQHQIKKGDVLSVARIAGIQAVKKTSEIIPLAHSGLPIESVHVSLNLVGPYGRSMESDDIAPGLRGGHGEEQELHEEEAEEGGIFNQATHSSVINNEASGTSGPPTKKRKTRSASVETSASTPEMEEETSSNMVAHPTMAPSQPSAAPTPAPFNPGSHTHFIDNLASSTRPTLLNRPGSPSANPPPYTQLQPTTTRPPPPVTNITPSTVSSRPVTNFSPISETPFGAHGGIQIKVTVETTAKTGVEMEALTGVMGAALTVLDMVKSIDKAARIEAVRVIGKKGGRSGGHGLFAT